MKNDAQYVKETGVDWREVNPDEEEAIEDLHEKLDSLDDLSDIEKNFLRAYQRVINDWYRGEINLQEDEGLQVPHMFMWLIENPQLFIERRNIVVQLINDLEMVIKDKSFKFQEAS